MSEIKTLEQDNDYLMIAWDMAMVLKDYLNGRDGDECTRAATVAPEIERRIAAAYNVTVDLKVGAS